MELRREPSYEVMPWPMLTCAAETVQMMLSMATHGQILLHVFHTWRVDEYFV
jgi:hypothetical protein